MGNGNGKMAWYGVFVFTMEKGWEGTAFWFDFMDYTLLISQ